MELLHHVEEIFEVIVQFGVLVLECTGVTTLLFTTAKTIWGCIRRDPKIRLTLAKGIALALEFKLGGQFDSIRVGRRQRRYRRLQRHVNAVNRGFGEIHALDRRQ